MAVFCIEKTHDYTVMSNHHLRNTGLSVKSKGLLSMMLSLPEDWNYTTRGLAKICKEGTDSIGSALKELERARYIVRNRLRDSKDKVVNVEYVIYETPHPLDTGQPCEDEPDTACPDTENPEELDARVYRFPTSSIKQAGRKINYYDYLMAAENSDCNAAVIRMVPRLHMDTIWTLIDDVPFLNKLQRRFYQKYFAAWLEKDHATYVSLACRVTIMTCFSNDFPLKDRFHEEAVFFRIELRTAFRFVRPDTRFP